MLISFIINLVKVKLVLTDINRIFSVDSHKSTQRVEEDEVTTDLQLNEVVRVRAAEQRQPSRSAGSRTDGEC